MVNWGSYISLCKHIGMNNQNHNSVFSKLSGPFHLESYLFFVSLLSSSVLNYKEMEMSPKLVGQPNYDGNMLAMGMGS